MPEADIPPQPAVPVNRPFWSPGRRVALIIAGAVAGLAFIGGGVAYAQSDSDTDTGSGTTSSSEDCPDRPEGRPGSPPGGDGVEPSPAETESQ